MKSLNIQSALFHIGNLDELARLDSPVHRIDARAKLVSTLAFIIFVASFDRYTVSALIPFALFPTVMAASAGIPPGPIIKRMLWAFPFIIMVGLANPFLDTKIIFNIGTLAISGGWISFASIMLRGILCISSALILIALTGMGPLAHAMDSLGMPRIFTGQVLLLYRYLFVTAEEAARMARAHALRSGGRKPSMHEFASMSGQWLLRSMDRAGRIHHAMACRGFTGTIPVAGQQRFTMRDLAFTAACLTFFVIARAVPITKLLGLLVFGKLQ